FAMTWHQWHHTASRSRMTKRFSAAARAKRSSLHSLHLGPSAANDGEAARAVRAMATRRTSFMVAPGSWRFDSCAAGEIQAQLFGAVTALGDQVDFLPCPSAFTSSRS